ncbi:hypothetical protein REPUB_Repub03eG0097600 [Reevesia pubescens]
MGFRKIILVGDSDSLTVIKRLRNNGNDLSLIGALLDDAKDLIGRFTVCKLSHVRNLCNLVADTLAKYVLGIDEEIVWVEDSPAIVESIVIK